MTNQPPRGGNKGNNTAPYRRLDKPFRRNVAALIRIGDKYLACQTSKHPNWQCVQGGYDIEDKSPEDALFRELEEELGATKEHFKIIHRGRYWRRYRFPREFLVRGRHGGQEQLWFLVEMQSLEPIDLPKSCGEFGAVKLVDVEELLQVYAKWKLAPFLDFCYELGVVEAKKRNREVLPT